MDVLKVSFSENDRHIYEVLIIGKDISKEDAQKLIDDGKAWKETYPNDYFSNQNMKKETKEDEKPEQSKE